MKKKLTLGDLKVSSFVTSMDKNEKQTVKGGAQTLLDCASDFCPTNYCVPPTHYCQTMPADCIAVVINMP